MRPARAISWMLAATPLIAIAILARHAAVLPESFVERRALGEATSRWNLGDWLDASDEPLHVVARLVHLAALQLPGVTIASAVWLNVLALVALVAVTTAVARRTLVGASGAPLAFALCALLFAAPAHAPLWLHGERIGMLLAPLLLVLALLALSANGGFGRRAVLAVLGAAVAPFCHVHGCAVAFALLPAMVAAARAAGSRRTVAFCGALLVVGNVAAVLSMRHVALLAVGDADCFAAFAAAPFDTTLQLVRAIGATWLDVLPATGGDELLLGAATLLLPACRWLPATAAADAFRRAAPWWSAWTCGLLIVVLGALRYELQPSFGTMRAAGFGACLVPIGALGVLGVRFGATVLLCCAGALTVLCVQDWQRGLGDVEPLRLRQQAMLARLLVPELAGEGVVTDLVREPQELRLLQERGWIPTLDPLPLMAAERAFDGDVAATAITLTGSEHGVRGSIDLATDAPQWIVVIAQVGDAPPQRIGDVQPTFAGGQHELAWQVAFGAPLVEGTRVRVVGLFVEQRRFVRLGPGLIVRSHELVAEQRP